MTSPVGRRELLARNVATRHSRGGLLDRREPACQCCAFVANNLVSVIIPTCIRGYCVERAIDSALGQTCPEVEVVVVDDGSR